MMQIAITGGRDRHPSDAELLAFSSLWTHLGGTVMVNGGLHRMSGGRTT